MIAIGRASTLSFPGRTYREINVGMAVVSNCWQNGHCRSTYSIIVAGADGFPSTLPCCGILAKRLCTSDASGRIDPVAFDELLPPVSATPRTIPTTIRTTTAAAAINTFGDAWRRRVPGALGGG